MSTARSRAARLLPVLQRGYGVQYWGTTYTAEVLAAQPHGLLILETAKIGAPYSDTGREVFFTPSEISAINHAGDRPVLGYLNVGEIENYRDYWVDELATRQPNRPHAVPDWYGPHTPQGDHLAAYWTQAWRDIVLARVDRLMATGVDGLFLDDVLHYYSIAADDALRWPNGERAQGPSDAPDLALEMMRLVEAIATRARAGKCDALIIVNNGVFIGRDAAEVAAAPDAKTMFSSYLDLIDAIMIENVSAPTTHPHTLEALREDFQDNDVPVLALDFAEQFPGVEPAELREMIAEKTRRAGFFPYLSPDHAFNQLSPPISLSSQGLAAAK